MTSPLPNGCAVSGLNETEGACPVCGKLFAFEPNSFAFLTGGALLSESNLSSVMEPNLEGFLSVGFHGAHSEKLSLPSAQLLVADDTPDGQFEIQFCSTTCLRQFLNRCVDQLENKVGIQNVG